MLDMQIRDGFIIDGTGAAGFLGCLDIHQGMITGVGTRKREARIVIPADGKCVAPGFIDAHSHADLALPDEEETTRILRQGVTTVVIGNCGFSAFPVRQEIKEATLSYGKGILGDFRGMLNTGDFSSYALSMKSLGIGINAVALTGHGTLHGALFGYAELKLSDDSLSMLADTLATQLEQGAGGLSLGLIYPPGSYASRRELFTLAKTVAGYGKVLSVHLRNEGEGLLSSIDEMFEIVESTGVHLHFSHHKAMGRESWGFSERSLEKMERMRERGFHITLDAYPYEAGCSTAMVLLPPWMLQGGFIGAMQLLENEDAYRQAKYDIETGIIGWENLIGSCGWERLLLTKAGSSRNEDLGKNLAELADSYRMEPLRFLFSLLRKEQGNANIAIFGMDTVDVDRIITWPDTLIGSDSLFSNGIVHPRNTGTFAKIIKKYVQKEKKLSLEEAISKMTLKTAQCFLMSRRGRLKEGYVADITLFDDKNMADQSDYGRPDKESIGVTQVILNGRLVWDKTGLRNRNQGKILII